MNSPPLFSIPLKRKGKKQTNLWHSFVFLYFIQFKQRCLIHKPKPPHEQYLWWRAIVLTYNQLFDNSWALVFAFPESTFSWFSYYFFSDVVTCWSINFCASNGSTLTSCVGDRICPPTTQLFFLMHQYLECLKEIRDSMSQPLYKFPMPQ